MHFRKLSILLVLTLTSCQLLPINDTYQVSNQRTNKVKVFNKTKLEKKNKKIVYRKFIDKSVPFIGVNPIHNSGYTGKGTYIAVLDTGIDDSNPLITGSVELEACFTTYKSCPNDTNIQVGDGAAKPVDWHGTHVSGIAAGNVYDKYKGVAPDAKIIAVNVFDSDETSSDEAIINALTWIYWISPKYNIASVNLSLGTSKTFIGDCDSTSPEMTNIVHALTDAGIAVVVAAGNSGSLGMSSPACISRTVSVAASDYSDDITYFSNISQSTTFAAPGSNIASGGYGSTIKYASGTSMAAPHVAGIFALYKQIYPNDSVATAVERIKSVSPTVFDYYADIYIKRIDIRNLLNTSTPSTTTTVPTPSTSTTTIPRSTTTTTSVPSYAKPQLIEVRALKQYSTQFSVTYKDSLLNKSYVSKYRLNCGGYSYDIPLVMNATYHVYYIQDMPLFTSCTMHAVIKNGDFGPSSGSVLLTIG